MPIQTPNPVTIIPPKTSGGSLKNAANLIAYAAAAQGESSELWGAVTKALKDAQSQLDGLGNALRGNLPIPNPIQVVNSSGALVAFLGDSVDPQGSAVLQGVWGQALYAGSGGLFYNPQSPRAVAYQNSAGTSLVTATLTALSFDTNAFNFGGVHSTSVNPTRFTAPVAGCYVLAGAMQAPAASGLLILELKKNGTTTNIPMIVQGAITNNNSGATVVCIGLIQLAANDFIEFLGDQTSGGTVTTSLITTWAGMALFSQP